jgi:hypothetical protein
MYQKYISIDEYLVFPEIRKPNMQGKFPKSTANSQSAVFLCLIKLNQIKVCQNLP